jgi:hypothetical protein
MKLIAVLLLAFSSVSQAALVIPTIPGGINLPRPMETYKNQICNQSCTDGVLKMSFMLTGEATGEKKCPAQVHSDLTISCGAYLCAQDGKNCAVSCENNSRCAPGFSCEDRKCIPERPISYFCSAQQTVASSRGESWDCSPMICQAGRCKDKCVTTNDCVPGSVCDTSNGSCVYVR